MTEEQLDVLCFGEALVDFFPTKPGARALQEVADFRRHLGGAPANVAVGVARLGLRTGLITRVGDDAFGDFIREELKNEGVYGATVGSSMRRTPVTFVSWHDSGERDFLFYRERSADTDLDAAFVEGHRHTIAKAGVVHLCSNTLSVDPVASATRRLVTLAQKAEVPISVDLNLRLHLWSSLSDARENIRWLIEQAALVKASEEEAMTLTDREDCAEAAQALVEMGPTLALVTRGAEGAVWYQRGGAHGSVPSPAVDVIDTTGAGDGFTSALLAGLFYRSSRGDGALLDIDAASLDPILRQACEAGAAVCSHIGATSGMPRQDTLFPIEV